MQWDTNLLLNLSLFGNGKKEKDLSRDVLLQELQHNTGEKKPFVESAEGFPEIAEKGTSALLFL